jgi:peroxiredoxin family protein
MAAVDVQKAIEELKTRVDGLPGAENKLTMIVFSGDLDKQLAAMIIATGAAAMGMKVVLFYTFWGTAALRDPKKKAKGKTFMGKMFGVMLPRGRNKLKLSQMHMAGMGTAMLKGLMKKKNVASLDQLYAIAAELQVKIYVCEMSMDLMGMKMEEMIDYPGMEIAGVATMLAHAKESAVQYFI